jgi:sulfate transport system permease protein
VDRDPAWVRWSLSLLAIGFAALFLVLPLVIVGVYAISEGLGVFVSALTDPDAQSAIRLTLITAAIVVPINTLFGLVAAWAIARFRFRGRSLLITLIDLPFAISPVIAGLMLVLVFGLRGWLGPSLLDWGIQVVFSTPGIVLATLFITFPFVARELIPLLESQGSEQEESALTLGASGWQMFLRITLPNIRWGLLYGMILCNARAMGEFGAVSIVSGHIRGLTNTLPLHVEVLYNDYQLAAAFACASLLALLAVFTLALKIILEWKLARDAETAARMANLDPKDSIASSHSTPRESHSIPSAS